MHRRASQYTVKDLCDALYENKSSLDAFLDIPRLSHDRQKYFRQVLRRHEEKKRQQYVETNMRLNTPHINVVSSSSLAITHRLSESAERIPIISSYSERKPTPEELFRRDCSEYTRQYLDTFAGKESHTDIVADLRLTPAELTLFKEKCLDPITSEIMDRPVVLNETVYDLKTLFRIKEGIDPNTRLKFEARDITASRQTVAEFERIINKIVTDRKAQLTGAPPSAATPQLGFSNKLG